MAEASKYIYTHKEIAAALIKEQGIHEGIWSVFVEFGLAAINAGLNDDDLAPTAIVPVQKIGIIKIDNLNNLSVDAAEVNPLPRTKRKRPDTKVI